MREPDKVWEIPLWETNHSKQRLLQEEAMDLAVYLEKIIQELENIPFSYEWNITTQDNGEHNRKMLDLEIENLGKEKED